MIKCILTGFIIIITFSTLKAQEIRIVGKILNEKTEPLADVSITLASVCQDSLIIAYALSDRDGKYSIVVHSLTCNKLILSFGMIGYARQQIGFAQNDTINYQFDVALSPTEIYLQEVIVKSKPTGFVQRKDTTKYNVSQYMDGSERKLEDILKKLPGISVTENGVISFNGKNIDKILVDGEEFFSRNYTMLSKNVSAGLIDQIEALDNFNDERLLKNLSQSDKVALNVKLKNKGQLALFGDLDAGIGTMNRYNESVTLFSFLKRTKLALIGNTNNTGDETLSNVQYNFSGNSNSSSISSSLTSHSGPIKNKLPANLEVGANRYVLNQALTTGIQFNHSFSSKLKLNWYAYLNKDQKNLNFSNRTDYLFPDSGFTIERTSGYTDRPLSIKSDLKLKYQATESSNIVYDLIIDHNSPQFMANMLLNTGPGYVTERFNGIVQEKLLNIDQRLSYTNRLSDKQALVLETVYTSYRNKDVSEQDTNRFSVVNSLIPSWNLQQYLRTQIKSFSASAKLLGTYKRNTYYLSFNVANSFSNLNSYLVGKDGSQPTPRLSINDISLKDWDFFIEAHDFITWNKFNLDLGLKLLRTSLTSTEYPEKHVASLSRWPVLPKVTLKYLPGNYHTFALSYEVSAINSLVTEIYNQPIISDYITLLRGSGGLNNNIQQDVGFRYRYANTNHQWILTFNSSVHLESSPYILQTSVVQKVLLNTYIPKIASTYYFYNRLQSDKYLRFLKSNLRLILTKSQNRLNNLIDSLQLQQNTLRMFSGSSSLITALDLPVNFQFGFTRTETCLKLALRNVVNSVSKYDVSSVMKVFKFFNLKAGISIYDWSSLDNHTIARFVDLRINYKNPKKKWGLSLNAPNLLQNKKIAYNETDNLSLSQSIYDLLGRYAILSFNYKF